MTQDEQDESDIEPGEAETWITALRLKMQKRSAVKIEEETGLSETRLSRHLKRIGISAMVLLHIHDRVDSIHKSVSALWEKVSAARKWMEQTVDEFRRVAAGLKEDLSATAARAKAELSRLVDEARRHSEEVKNAKQKAIEDTKRAIEPLAVRVHDDADEVRAARDDAVAHLKTAASPILVEMHASLDTVKQMCDSITERVSDESQKAVARLQDALRNEVGAAKDTVSCALQQEVARVKAELDRLAELRSRTEGTEGTFKEKLEQILRESKQHADRTVAVAAVRLTPLQARCSSLAREMDRVSNLQKSVLSTSREALDRMISSRTEVESARAELRKAKEELEARDRTFALQLESINALTGAVTKMCEFTYGLVATDSEKAQWQQIHELQARALDFQKKGETWQAIQCHWAIMRVGTKPPRLGWPGWSMATASDSE